MIEVEGNKYELIENYKEGFDKEAFIEKYTEYFEPYDYIIGDWSYGKLRLKGFCTRLNKMCNKINDIKFKDDYIKNLCSYECKYFVLEKKKDKKSKCCMFFSLPLTILYYLFFLYDIIRLRK